MLNLSLLQPDGTETDRRGVIGVDHGAYTYASLNDLFENYPQLKEKGILPYGHDRLGVTGPRNRGHLFDSILVDRWGLIEALFVQYNISNSKSLKASPRVCLTLSYHR